MQRRVSVLPASLLLVLFAGVCLGPLQRFGCLVGIIGASGGGGGSLKPQSLNLKAPMSSHLVFPFGRAPLSSRQRGSGACGNCGEPAEGEGPAIFMPSRWILV